MDFLRLTDTALDLLADHARHRFAPHLAAGLGSARSTPTLTALRNAEGSWHDTAVEIDEQLKAHLLEVRGTFCGLADNDDAMAHHLQRMLSADGAGASTNPAPVQHADSSR
ncbi:hypothetical protein [Corynebacterium pseudodiphtheriticum]|uniref:Uncharacterized protein n=1 Tax=Corynebacterium pseudodiphtheriticum TaxID=37637 RepID=A0ABT7FVK5_9CORY|nr:hypothetical protein [Corynebacterium pseudodiphtheriticum]MDK4289798.1 hypothetical protein [Corynebacterium pseudodiphtheriticum]